MYFIFLLAAIIGAIGLITIAFAESATMGFIYLVVAGVTPHKSNWNYP